MGLLFNDKKEFSEKVEKIFGDRENYLVAFKANDLKTGLGKLILSNIYYTFDSSRTFILYFSPKGLYESEISNSMKRDFFLMPWNEIEEFEVEDKNNKAIISLRHLGKKVMYEVDFKGKIFDGNEERFMELKSKDWNRI
ncbi:histidine kinase [Peptoniphilus harei]|uniref:histidine kinase n=1 Tax=Peptoniphilus harei TaxID=54005 RepID=UPI0029142597|nr:histidine kinase [Peptoniphilus harei]MDU5417338.1 histidine kinase [Peptoniphilus harei]